MQTNSWIPAAPPQTPAELLRALTQVVHDLLQASFAQPSEQVTILAYRACSYLTQLNSARSEQDTGEAPPQANQALPHDPTVAIFALDNSLIEAEATLEHMMHHHRDLPRRHLYNEIARVEQLLKDTKQVMNAWGKDPEAPGAHEGVAGLRNALDALDWCHLAVEEGSIAQIGETLQQATAAVKRSRGYMDSLLEWLHNRFADARGSPAKRQRSGEKASGSNQAPTWTGALPAQPPFPPPPLQLRPAPDDQREREEHEQALSRELRDRHDRRPARHSDGTSNASQLQHQREQGRPCTGEATPYAVLRAQEILQQAMPFAEQELAHFLAEAHAHLAAWTTSIWGHPIQLVADSSMEQEVMPTQPEHHGELTPASQAETVLFPQPTRGRPPETSVRRTRQPSHRRRRLQAALANTSESSDNEDGD